MSEFFVNVMSSDLPVEIYMDCFTCDGGCYCDCDSANCECNVR